MLIFNSRDKLYKTKISAIATNEKVKFRIVVPRDMHASSARLIATKDGENPVAYSMFWAGMCGDDNEFWELHFYATTSGLYFYHFEIDTPWGTSFIKNIGMGKGDFSPDSPDFQQTVYDENFTVPSFLNGGIIYQIFPDRFYNSKQKKYNVKESRVIRKWGDEPFWREEQMNGLWNNDYFCGDLKGITEKLDYLSDLGVTCIYLNPIFEANSNHRYDTADYEKIDPLLGTEVDFKHLCRAAKQRGISIILDGVFSHTGCDSKYFNKYSNYDSIGAYNSKDSQYFNWYKFINWNEEYDSWWGIKLLPEVKEENESYREYICGENGIARKWLRLGASGWRLDVADELPDVFLDDFRKAVKAEKEDAVVLGEVWEDATTKVAYSQRRRYLLGQQLDSVMNYPFANAILGFVRFGNAEQFNNRIMSIVENYPQQVLNVLMNHIGTHDTERAMTALVGPSPEGRGRQWQYDNNKLTNTEFKKGIKLLKLASFLQYMLPGVPSVYYGDERGMYGMKDPFNRACIDWRKENKELLNWYKKLGQMRHGCRGLKNGELIPVYSIGNVAVFERSDNVNHHLFAVNVGDTELSIPIDGWDNCYALIGTPAFDGVLTIGAYECILLSK